MLYDNVNISLNHQDSSGGCVTENNFVKDSSSKSKTKISGELAEKITAGEASASNEFVQINYSWLLFIVRNKFSKSNNHEDIVQDTFMLVIKKLQQGAVNNPITILAYLRTTAINIGFEYLRKDKKFASAVDQEMITIIADAKDDILSTLIWDDKISYVKKVIAELKIQRDKDILTKFYFDEESKVSICSKLDLSTEHFDRVLYRAKDRLKQLIAQIDDDPKGKLNILNKDKNPVKTSSNFVSRIHHFIKHKSLSLLSLLKYQNTTRLGDIK